ncbi:MAG: Tn3 family transposase [Actinobacteria bacterium]|nr:Tn3 family transposase [Actinomycetota bacterium]
MPEVILEVMSWLPGFAQAFAAVSGGRSRLEDLHVSIAACLTAHAMNIDLVEVAKRGVPALNRRRLSHINQNYLGAEAYTAGEPVPGRLSSGYRVRPGVGVLVRTVSPAANDDAGAEAEYSGARQAVCESFRLGIPYQPGSAASVGRVRPV